jgi:hypothetical protein
LDATLTARLARVVITTRQLAPTHGPVRERSHCLGGDLDAQGDLRDENSALDPGGANAIGRMLGLLGDEWTLLILQQALLEGITGGIVIEAATVRDRE